MHNKLPDFNKIRHIVFDLDHTLWDYDTNAAFALGVLYQQFGYERFACSLERFIAAYRAANESVWAAYSRSEIHKWQLRATRFDLMRQKLGLPAETLQADFAEAFLDLCPRQDKLMPGVEAMLETLAGRFQLHVITNGFADTQLTKLTSAGIADYFSHVVTSEKLRAAKPHPEIYGYLQRLTSDHDGASYFMIGDNLEADVLGPKAFGWQAALYDPKGEYAARTEHLRIEHWEELSNLMA